MSKTNHSACVEWYVKCLCVYMLPAWSPEYGTLPVFPSTLCASPALQFPLYWSQQWRQHFGWLRDGGRQLLWYDPVGPTDKNKQDFADSYKNELKLWQPSKNVLRCLKLDAYIKMHIHTNIFMLYHKHNNIMTLLQPRIDPMTFLLWETVPNAESIS